MCCCCSYCWCYLVHSRESFGAFDCSDQAIPELLVAFVGRQVQSVEAGVSAWKAVSVAPFLYGERLRTITSVEFFETIHWYPRCSGDELK